MPRYDRNTPSRAAEGQHISVNLAARSRGIASKATDEEQSANRHIRPAATTITTLRKRLKRLELRK